MRFKTRLGITFATVLLLPLLLIFLSILLLGVYVDGAGGGDILSKLDYAWLTRGVSAAMASADEAYAMLNGERVYTEGRLEDVYYLELVNGDLLSKNVFLVGKKGDEVYYAGSSKTKELLPYLPPYGKGGGVGMPGFYEKNTSYYIRQIDFAFRDGDKGSLYVVAAVPALISKEVLADLLVLMLLTLALTGYFLTHWIYRGVMQPVGELNQAMQHIKEGHYDHVLPKDLGGEIGQLYTNYEEMRLRLKESEEETRLHARQNRELISNISHDLKTPITSIRGYVEGIMDGVADTPEKMDRYIRTIYNKANDLARLINELTLYSNIENNTIPYNFHRIRVKDYFRDCIEEVGLELEGGNIQLEYTNLVEEDAQIIADPEQLKKVMNNVLGNSVKYMDKPQGRISIRLQEQDGGILVEICDNGPGIAQSDIDKVFERFYRSDASRNTSLGGSGIGLSIVKKIIEDHSGYVWATSREGEGACVHFVIKRYRELE